MAAGMNRLGMLAMIVVIATGFFVLASVLHYWPAMLRWLGFVPSVAIGFVPSIAMAASIGLYLGSACELCGHTCLKHLRFTSLRLSIRCAICGCMPSARASLRWLLFRQQRRS